MSITEFDRQQLEEIHSQWRSQFPGRKEDYFPVLFLTKKFNLEVPEAARQVAWGNNDYGIDGFHVDRTARNLYLFQFKWSESHSLFRESLDRLYNDGINRIFDRSMTPDPQSNEMLNALRAELYESRDLIRRVLIQFVFKGDLDSADNSEGLQQRRELLESKAAIVHQFFGSPDVQLSVEFIADKKGVPRVARNETHQIRFSSGGTIETSDRSRRMSVGFASLMDLVQIYLQLEQQFLARNIRSALPSGNTPNKKIREALREIVLRKTIPPEFFPFYHNGVTVACEEVTLEGDGKCIVKVPRLLNGAQTISTVRQFLDEEAGKLGGEAESRILDSIRVVAKFIEDDPASAFVTQVTIANNQQNPVEAWHLRANDRIQCDLQDKFRSEVGIFYSRQENAFKNLTIAELEATGYTDTARDIRIRTLAQTFLAAQGELSRMSHLSEVFENERLYKDTFKEAYLHGDSSRIVLAYKIHFFLNDVLRVVAESLPQYMQPAIRRVRSLAWAILIQAVLNDPNCDEIKETFGRTLRREHGYRDYLRKLAKKYVVPLLKEVLSAPGVKEKLEQAKTDFLRTKNTYDQCRKSAASRWNWSRRSF